MKKFEFFDVQACGLPVISENMNINGERCSHNNGYNFEFAIKAGIKFSSEYQITDKYIISVPTPYDKFSKKVDVCYVIEAVKEIVKV